ncbi:hypothetical protein HDU93_007655 [Gonapodya sp. JEL0774]|nr:hypothetical protein HDU93_007655 [Gonapodya sp. JEL0774]
MTPEPWQEFAEHNKNTQVFHENGWPLFREGDRLLGSFAATGAHAQNGTDLKENKDLVEYCQNYAQETDKDTDNKDEYDLHDDEAPTTRKHPRTSLTTDPSAPVETAGFQKLADALEQGLMGRAEMAMNPVERALRIAAEDGFTDAERADLAVWFADDSPFVVFLLEWRVPQVSEFGWPGTSRRFTMSY